jgi:hypothetical protein
MTVVPAAWVCMESCEVQTATTGTSAMRSSSTYRLAAESRQAEH